ncbi:MAG TPA: cytidylate kinase-like family protein [Terracidiphilus sp.]|nr:cytidylate kinase-like family protein [Terracidiphilus sp.]
MKYRALTVAREFGSGGGRIAQTVARWLGWKLLDQEIIGQIARAAHVDSKVVKHYDERVDSWLRRMNEEAIRGVALASGRPLAETDIFDAQLMAKLTRGTIEEAYAEGNCVIVGRGAQCILGHQHDAFHVFVYAPLRERLERLRKRLAPDADIEQRLRTVDGERAKYLHQHFGRNWCDPHLYDLMLRSTDDEDAAARMILYAMNGEPTAVSETSEMHTAHA